MSMDPFEDYASFYDLDYADFDADWHLIQQFAIRSGSPILELGCGTGRLLVPLAEAGFQVTGVDASTAMLALAGEKVLKAGLNEAVTLVRQDMRELDLENRYNMAFAAINSFLHMMTAEDQVVALARAYQHLKQDGLLVLDLFNPHPDRLLDLRGQVILDKVMSDPCSDERWMKFRTQTVDLAAQTIHTSLFVDRIDCQGGVQRTLFSYSLRYIFRGELELLLQRAGFQLEAIYGSYELEEFTDDSDKMIAVARVPWESQVSNVWI
jgi:ubiquinone/menaquinone biosynthesis C-methylase UbiE